MKKIFLFLAFLLFSNTAHATTWYACSGGGNWNGAATWTSVLIDQVGCIGALGNPVAGDTAVLNSTSGNVTITASAAAATLDETGYTGTLAFGTQTLTLTAASNIGGAMTSTSGSLTSSGAITLLSTPTGTFPLLTQTGTNSMTPGGFTWPGNYTFPGANGAVFTLNGNFIVSGICSITTSSSATISMAGAFNITCGTLTNFKSGSSIVGTGTFKFLSGQTLTVTTAIDLYAPGTAGGGTSPTISSTTASSSTFITYTGTPANCFIVGFKFTDIDASGSSQGLYNYFGSTLTRTSNIYNVTQANIGGIFIQ